MDTPGDKKGSLSGESVLGGNLFGAATNAWFRAAFASPTAVQERGWRQIATGAHTLLIAPTGSGKTLAAFLWCVDRLCHRKGQAAKRVRPDAAVAAASSSDAASGARAGRRRRPPVGGVRVVYVSPLKALVYDIERNLRAPLAGIATAADSLGTAVTVPDVAVRTGDTSAKERQRLIRHPADILVTTPESLYLILGGQARERLRSVETIIIDEVHALAPTKRGAHLALSLERLAHLCRHDPQRIGLSATARPLSEVARFVGGDRDVAIVDTGMRPALDLQLVVPVADMNRPQLPPDQGDDNADNDDVAAATATASAPSDTTTRGERGMWPTIYPRLIELITSHHTTIVFVNSRGLCERLTQQLNDLAGEELARSHHGSLAHSERKQVEEDLKAGRIAAIVATSSLELGIDMDAVDLVILVESPSSVASGLQRIGRAGHGAYQVSKGRVFPKHRGDLLQATVVCARMAEGAIEAIQVPDNPLDVLAQQVVAAVAVAPWPVEGLRDLCMRAANFRHLPRDAFAGVLDMLAGRYPSTDFAELSPRVIWDRERDILNARRGAKMLSLLSGGTIPDRGLYRVHLGADGPKVGELDEEMVHETIPGETFTLGASTWRVDEITRDRVIVSPAPGEAGKLPFWHGDRPGRPLELGRAIGAFIREIAAFPRERAESELRNRYHLDPLAAGNLYSYLDEERSATGTLPTDRAITVEQFYDELGDMRVAILSPFGARVHAPWAMAIDAALPTVVQSLWSDDGIMLRLERPQGLGFTDDDPGGHDEAPISSIPDAAWRQLFPDPATIEEVILGQLAQSALFAGHFRENAARALLMPRRRPGQRTPLWLQRLKAQSLLAVAQAYPAFPIVMETYRTCLRDIFDVPALAEILTAIERGDIAVHRVHTKGPSPFARSLAFAYVAGYLYEGDAPVAERRAHALSLDRQLLSELLGRDDWRDLLDAEVIGEVEADLQWRSDSRRAAHADAVHDLLRRVGDLDDREIAERWQGDAATAAKIVAELAAARRICRIDIAGHSRWIVVEDVAMYRDALGVTPPAGIPASLLESNPDADRAQSPAGTAVIMGGPVAQLFLRWARTHGPFLSQHVADRFALAPVQAHSLLDDLAARGIIQRGGFIPGGSGIEYCSGDVVRLIKRKTLARLREQVAPVDAGALARFLPRWHGIGGRGHGQTRLEEALTQLEGLPLPLSELEGAILPARIADFRPAMLDEMGAMGRLVWVGCGRLGARDGKIALYRRERAGQLLAPGQPVSDGVRGSDTDTEAQDDSAPNAIEQRIVDHLRTRGASFLLALQQACAPATTDQVLQALRELAWSGVVTCDILAPLRALARWSPAQKAGAKPSVKSTSGGRRRGSFRPRLRRGSGRRGTGLAAHMSAGRWSLVSDLASERVSETERVHNWASKLLARHGIVTRESATIEATSSTYSALYQVLRAMEESGKVRRGYFIAGLDGAQFVLPGVVDRLREVAGEGGALVLSAIDPANPFGWLLPWPSSASESAAESAAVSAAVSPGDGGTNTAETGARRATGARVIVVDGAAVLYLDASARRLLCFIDAGDGRLPTAAAALRTIAGQRRGKRICIERINGEPARQAPQARVLQASGFVIDRRGLLLEL